MRSIAGLFLLTVCACAQTAIPRPAVRAERKSIPRELEGCSHAERLEVAHELIRTRALKNP